MDTIKAIFERQSTGEVMPDPIGRETIEVLLSAAVQAPNHYKVRPWRFVVISGTARERLGEVLARSSAARFPEATEGALVKEMQKPLRAPVIIAAGVDKPTEAKVLPVENLCAAAAAVENLLLAAHALGLAAIWRTGEAVRDPMVKAFLGFAPDQEVIALVYLGHPLHQLPAPQRPGFEDRTVFME